MHVRPVQMNNTIECPACHRTVERSHKNQTTCRDKKCQQIWRTLRNRAYSVSDDRLRKHAEARRALRLNKPNVTDQAITIDGELVRIGRRIKIDVGILILKLREAGLIK